MPMARLGRRVVMAAVLITCASLSAGGAMGRGNRAVAAPTSGSASGGSWVLATHTFVNHFDAEPYVGNGYFSQRIPAAGMGLRRGLGEIGWPLDTPRTNEALAAGVYAYTDASKVYPHVRKQVIALIPTWSTLTFATPSGTYSAATASKDNVRHYTQRLDLRTGTVTTSGVWRSPGGQQARFVYQVFTDRGRAHVAVVRLSLTPLWSGPARVTSMLDGSGAARLIGTGAGVRTLSHTIHVTAKAVGTGFPVAESATLGYSLSRGVRDVPLRLRRAMSAGEEVAFTVRRGHTYRFTKYVSAVTGRDAKAPARQAGLDSLLAARLGEARLARENAAAWKSLWTSDIVVSRAPTLQAVIHANTYDLYASIRPNAPDAIGPSGLSSDGYAGAIFWDSDIWMFPAMVAAHPDIAKVAVDYRFHTLAAAEHDARVNGYRGAFYPWTAGDDGRTGHDCYGTVTTPEDKIISDPNKSCSEELHLQADIALSQWEYYEATGDRHWLASHGWPVLQALANFWASKAAPSGGGAYSLNDLQPPDESHTGVNNSIYTNAAAITALRDATSAAKVLGRPVPSSWGTVAAGLVKTMPFNAAQNIYEEFAGYAGDQIKQADAVMLTYPLAFPMPSTVGLSDLNYYAPRTSLQGPAMTDAIHSIDASTLDASGCSAYTYMLRSYEPFLRQPYQQMAETRSGKTTAFNFLTGVGGFLQVFEYGFSGLRFGTDAVNLDPSLPPQLPGVTLTHLSWHGRVFTVAIGPQRTIVSNDGRASVPIHTPAGLVRLAPGARTTMLTRRPDQQLTSDLARCRSVSATSSVPGDDPVAAVDGSIATPWIAAQPRADLTVSLAHTASVDSATITRGSGFGSFPYAIEVSTDDVHWQVVATAPAKSTGVDSLRFASVAARYVRLHFPGASGSAAPDIGELSVGGS